MSHIWAKLEFILAQPFTDASICKWSLLMQWLDTFFGDGETFWWSRSKVHWMKDKDRNTRFFHQWASNRKSNNIILGLMDNNWCSNWIWSRGTKYCSQLFPRDVYIFSVDWWGGSPWLIGISSFCYMANQLDKDFTVDEIKNTLFQM